MNIRNLYSTWYDKQRAKSVKSFVQNAGTVIIIKTNMFIVLMKL